MWKGFEGEFLYAFDMYAKFSSLPDVEGLLYKIPDRDMVSWNSMVRGYVMNHRHGVQQKIIYHSLVYSMLAAVQRFHKKARRYST